MDTVRMMWALSKPMTVITLVMAVLLVVALVVLWWLPVGFGYPLYAVAGNLFTTALAGFVAWQIRSVVRY